MMRSEAILFSRANKYLFATRPSDNNLFHENAVTKYLFKKYSSPPLEIEMVATLIKSVK